MDWKVWDLADCFLSEEPWADEAKIKELAGDIQMLIEDFIERNNDIGRTQSQGTGNSQAHGRNG